MGDSSSATLTTPDDQLPVPEAPLELPDRYEDRGLIGRGGMGEVRRVWDRHLDRLLAMKIIRHAAFVRGSNRDRFLAEAKVTAALQHPGVVPLHDAGALADGRLWYTMRVVRGTDLRAALQGPRDAAALRRLIASFEAACQAVAFAHSRGVIHRDLKPENLMIGEFGEVLVVDWGLAGQVRGADEAADEEPAARGQTRYGQVLGTLAYMPPEQASGQLDRVGPASDVFALGTILAEIVRDGPEELVELAAVARRSDPAERPPDARAFAAALRGWLDGAHRRDRAAEAVARADAVAPEVEALRARAASLSREADALLDGVPPHAPVEAKQPAWRLQDDAAAVEREALIQELGWQQHLRAALDHAPDFGPAHARLADHHQARMAEAEARRDHDAAARHEVLLRQHDRGRHAGWLQGDGALCLLTDPPDAAVALYRVVERDRRLVPVLDHTLRAPVLDLPLPRGSYLLRLTAPGRAPLTYPVHLDRRERWDGVPPGAAAPLPIRLPEAGALGNDDVAVPAGWTWAGGDPDALDSLSRRRLWIHAFAIRRFPVTNAEYLAFLNDLVATGREAEALAAVPAEAGGRTETALPIYTRNSDGIFEVGVDRTLSRWDPDCPVCHVDWSSAVAFAAWLADRSGLPWRLPHDQEWEKAGRGADARCFPWGDWFDPSWAAMSQSFAGKPTRVPVTDFPGDESPYGVRGLAGNVREWCANPYRRGGDPDGAAIDGEAAASAPGEARMARGGSWSTMRAAWCRLAARFADRPAIRAASLGFRVARSLG